MTDICTERGRHTYDEHGICFECGAAQPTKAQMMSRMRQERREKGLVEFRAWVTPLEKSSLEGHLKKNQKK